MDFPTIGVHTHVTNPLSTGYLSYLAAIESWARVADKIIVVDGGSSDNSIPILFDWLGTLANKVKVISTQESSWGENQLWFWPQIAINRQIGFDLLDTDWVIHVDADHVLQDNISRNKLNSELTKHDQSYVLSFWVSAFYNTIFKRRIRTRTWIVNKKKCAEENVRLVYGLEEESGSHLDYPIIPRKHSCYIDPITGIKKTYFVGTYAKCESVIDIDVVRYGHFFFNYTQCFQKCERLDLVLSRYLGKAPSRDLDLLLNNGIWHVKRKKGMPKESVLNWSHPHSVKRLISTYYQPNMCGGILTSMIDLKNLLTRFLYHFMRIDRFVRSELIRKQGFRGLKDLHKWLPLDTVDPEPLDVKAIYMEQDKYLPARYRINWNNYQKYNNIRVVE